MCQEKQPKGGLHAHKVLLYINLKLNLLNDRNHVPQDRKHGECEEIITAAAQAKNSAEGFLIIFIINNPTSGSLRVPRNIKKR